MFKGLSIFSFGDHPEQNRVSATLVEDLPRNISVKLF